LTKNYHYVESIYFISYTTFFSNLTGPFHTRVSSVFPTVKDKATDWKCCQCSKQVYKDHSITTIQVTSNSCQEQSSHT